MKVDPLSVLRWFFFIYTIIDGMFYFTVMEKWTCSYKAMNPNSIETPSVCIEYFGVRKDS